MTVAELKRRIQPGTRLKSVYVNPTSSMFSPNHPFYNEVATVRRVMSTQFTVNRPYKGAASESYCAFPKASELTETPNGFRITKAPNMILEYVWVCDECDQPSHIRTPNEHLDTASLCKDCMVKLGYN